MSATTRYRRISITLPAHLVEAIDEMAPRNGRSALVAKAVGEFVEADRRRRLRHLLADEYVETAREALQIAAEFYPLEEEADAHIWAEEDESE